jgi:uncharacterized damage-inducible protein DinB
MFRGMDDFFKVYDQNSEATVRILKTLDDAILGQPVAAGHRTLGQIAWHIVTTIPEMMQRTGLHLSAMDPDAPPPSSAPAIVEGYQTATKQLRDALQSQWTDEALAQTDEMYGQRWPRGMTLGALLAHEGHHRGQMTVLLRQAGARVPGIYGPAKEEWAQIGMEAPPY